MGHDRDRVAQRHARACEVRLGIDIGEHGGVMPGRAWLHARARVVAAAMRLGFAVKVLGADLPSHDTSAARRAHADMVDQIGCEHVVTETARGLDVDVMHEAKGTDLALLRLCEQLAVWGVTVR
jgi:hypothetical protein